MTDSNISAMIYGMIVGEFIGIINSNSNVCDEHVTRYKLIHPFQYHNLSLHIRLMFQLGISVVQMKTYNQGHLLNAYFLSVGEDDRFKIKNTNMINIYNLYNQTKFSMNHKDVLTKLSVRGELNQTNEALLRCIPLLLCGDDSVKEDCNVTNPYGDCIDCNIFFLRLLKRCLTNERVKLDEKMSVNLNIRKIIFLAKNKFPMDLKYNVSSWSNALYCALYAYSHIDSFEEGMRWVIKNSSKKDVTENAAMVGCVVGAKMGKKIEEESITRKNFYEVRQIMGQTGLKGDVDLYINTFYECFTDVANKK